VSRPFWCSDRAIATLVGANRHAMVVLGLLPVVKVLVSQLGAAAVAVALGGQGSQGLAPAPPTSELGVSLLIMHPRTNIWILDIVETHRKADVAWPSFQLDTS